MAPDAGTRVQATTSRRGLWCEMVDLVPPWQRRGRPVVMHHGIGADHRIWARWVLALAQRHPIVRFDMRGFGRSAALPLPAGDLLGELVADLLDVAGPAPVHLIGESIGGTIVLAAAARHPERVASVTVSNAGYRGQGIGQIGGWRAMFEADGVAGWSEHMMKSRFGPDAIDADARHWFAGVQQQTAPAAALAVADMLAATDLTAELAALRAPLMILAPDASPFVPLHMAQELHRLVPGSGLHVFEGVRHGLVFSHADACARLARDFLERAGP